MLTSFGLPEALRLAAKVRRAGTAQAVADTMFAWFGGDVAAVRVCGAEGPIATAGDRTGAPDVLGFGAGESHHVELSVAAPVPAEAKEQLRVVGAAVADALETGESAGATEIAAERVAELERTVERLRAEAAVVDYLHAVGRHLTAQLDVDVLVQEATDAAVTATGAAFGAFFYNLINEYGESYTLYTLSGAPREAFSVFPMPRNTEVFAPTFEGTGTVRSDDITRDPRYGHNAPHHGMPEGHLPVCSYLAVPVTAPSTGEVLGGFFFGHSEPGRFDARGEYLAEGIAGYTAIALDNARMFARERNMASELSRSMLPEVPSIPGLGIVSRYQPASTGSKVGGDWFDVIELPGDRTAFVIGDVVGRGVSAAAVMGQVRTAIRSCAVLDLPPCEVLRTVSQLVGGTPEASFVTCFYAVHDPATETLTYANAGHLPAVLLAEDGTAEQIGEALAMPLGVGGEFPERESALPSGGRLVLYTDGLVESHTRDLVDGIDALLRELRTLAAATDVERACDELIATLTGGRHDDDIALLYVRFGQS